MPVQPSSTSADLDGEIRPEDKDAGKLTLEQARRLVYWADCQDAWLFDGAPLRMILAMWHASERYETFENWLNHEPVDAADAYNRYARFNGLQPIYVDRKQPYAERRL